MPSRYVHAIDTLVAERGERANSIYKVDLTTKDIAEKLGHPATENEYRLIMNTVKTVYPNTIFERANGDAGWLLHFKIRVK